MTTWQARPEAVEQAVAWLRENDGGFTEEALVSALRGQGYAEAEIAIAMEQRRIERAPEPTGPDLRRPAAAFLVAMFLTTWGILSFGLLDPPDRYGVGGLAAVILGGLLFLVMLLGLAIIRASNRLKRGVKGAMVAVLAFPFILLVIIAGLCVATMQPFSPSPGLPRGSWCSPLLLSDAGVHAVQVQLGLGRGEVVVVGGQGRVGPPARGSADHV